MHRGARFCLVAAFAGIAVWSSIAASQELFPPGVTVIDPPSGEDIHAGNVTRSERFLVMAGTTPVDPCPGDSTHCPVFHFYERINDTWVPGQSVRFADSGLAFARFVAEDRLLLNRTIEATGGRSDSETFEYRFNPGTETWETTQMLGAGRRSYLVTYHEGTYFYYFRNQVSIHEYVGGSWQITDTLYLETVRDFSGLYDVVSTVARDGIAYILFCESSNCANTRGVALLDMATRQFTDYFETSIPGNAGMLVFDDQVILTSHSSPVPQIYQAPQVYERVGGTWQYVGEALPSFEWDSKDGWVAQNDNTFFETRVVRLGVENADAVTFFQYGSLNAWEQVGTVIVPNGEGILYSLSLEQAYGNIVYFREGPGGHFNRVIEVDDYLDYLDLDEDVMPKWWEELYGFSPDAFDDFLGDTDGDGLTDTREYGLMTSPLDSDTDDDQMPDGWEYDYFFNPRDPSDGDQDFDADGISNRDEYLNGTNPTVADNPPPAPPPPSSSGGGGGSTGLLWLSALALLSARRRLWERLQPRPV